MSSLLAAVPLLAQEAVTLEAEDGVVVHADRYDQWTGRSRGVILLFHEADGNALEYHEIAPRLAAQGFDALAIDQRLGGTMYGLPNRTVAGLTGPVMSTDAVLPDLRAAVDHAREAWPGAPILLWGSSYSADLVVALAADAPEGVAGVLAFSPVGLMRERDLLDVARDVAVPVFITYASGDGERVLAADLADALPDGLAVLHAPTTGMHGSTTLMETINPAGWEDQWEAVTAFLARVAP